MLVVITGASKGIGRAIADIFAANGANLLLCARGEVALYNTVDALTTHYPSVTVRAKPADLSVPAEAVAFANWCLEAGAPDILVNNAGRFEPGSVYNEPEGVLERQLATNLFSAYHVTRTILPAMLQNPLTAAGRGHIFNMCSIASLNAYANGGAYSISKFALHGFSKNLREEMKPHGVKVTALFPGAVMSDSWEGFDNSNNRIMEATDIAKMVYAASSLSPQACVEELVIRPQLGDL